jgi:hypothetical protein
VEPGGKILLAAYSQLYIQKKFTALIKLEPGAATTGNYRLMSTLLVMSSMKLGAKTPKQ